MKHASLSANDCVKQGDQEPVGMCDCEAVAAETRCGCNVRLARADEHSAVYDRILGTMVNMIRHLEKRVIGPELFIDTDSTPNPLRLLTL